MIQEHGIIIDTEHKTILSLAYSPAEINLVYAIVQGVYDRLEFVDDEVPLTAVTPWDYNLAEGWMLTFLNEGSFYTDEIHIKMSEEDLVGRR